jgi:sulfur relay (sulfurtransferase) complex TusBCD TusD component (DsrE family)
MTGRATAILFTRFGLGQGPEDLQLRLARSFLTVLRDLPEPPAALLFYTDGVKLACDGSPVLDELRHFAEHGASIVLCGTCVDYFGLRDQVRVGTVAGMAAIIEAMVRADKVITP